MTITVTDIVAGPFVGTGAAQVLPFTFKAFTDEEVEVYSLVDEVELIRDPDTYTVALNEDVAGSRIEGGSVTLTAAVGLALYVRAKPSFDQFQTWSNQGSRLSNLNEALDRGMLAVLRVKYDLDKVVAAAGDAVGLAGKVSLTALAGAAGGDLIGIAGGGTLADLLADELRLMDYIPLALRPAIRAHTSVVDVSVYVQEAFDDAVALGKRLRAPRGKFKIQNVELPDNLHVVGDLREATIFSAISNASDCFTNANTAGTRRVKMTDLTIQGGRRGINIVTDATPDPADRPYPSEYTFERVLFELATDADVYSDFGLILFNFIDTIFNGFGSGGARTFSHVVVIDGTANANTFFLCQFKELPGVAIDFRVASEATVVLACRFEAMRLPIHADSQKLFNMNGAKSFHVEGCYIEGVHQIVLREINSVDGIAFSRNRFSGANPGNVDRDIFNSTGIVTFDTNDFQKGSNGAKQMFLRGRNKGLDDTLSWVWDANKTGFVSPFITLVNADKIALFEATLTAPTGSASADNHSVLGGSMTLTFVGNDTGGNKAAIRYSRDLVLSGFANTTIDIGYGAVENRSKVGAAVTNEEFGLPTAGPAATAGTYVFGAGLTMTNRDHTAMRARFSFDRVVLFSVLAGGFSIAASTASGPAGPWT